jgi:hypothetical protein
MTSNERRTISDHEQLPFGKQTLRGVAAQWSVVGCRWIVIALLLILLPACGAATTTTTTANPGTGGDVNPEAVAQHFLEDLGKALKDPGLKNEEKREQWVITLANYFVPRERENQRELLEAALGSFVADLETELAADESFTIEIRFDDIVMLPGGNDQRVLTQPVNGHVYLLITRGDYITHERETPLADIIGRPDGALPTVREGKMWFLTEQYN